MSKIRSTQVTVFDTEDDNFSREELEAFKQDLVALAEDVDSVELEEFTLEEVEE